MKKLICLLFVLCLCGCNGQISDGERFKNEYEKYNGETDEYGYICPPVEIAKDNPIVYVTQSEALEILQEGSGILMFGFPTCPWCRSGLPVLLEAAQNKGINKIYYCNNRKLREDYEIKDGEIVLTNSPSEEYKGILEALGEYASDYLGMEEYGLKRLYYPTYIFLDKGKITGFHESTLEEGVSSSLIISDPYVPMTSLQHDTLLKIFEDLIVSMSGCKLDQKC